MDEEHFYNYKIWSHGNCCQCGTPLKENEGLFLCNKCKDLNEKYYDKHKNKENKDVSE